MERVMINKENGEIRKIYDKELINILRMNTANPCNYCDCAYADKCQKIADYKEKDIQKYDFITDGYQINDEDGLLEEFTIINCQNFEKDHLRRKVKTKEELKALRELKNNLKIIYFDACDIKEADEIQRHLISSGFIYDPTLENRTKTR